MISKKALDFFKKYEGKISNEMYHDLDEVIEEMDYEIEEKVKSRYVKQGKSTIEIGKNIEDGDIISLIYREDGSMENKLLIHKEGYNISLLGRWGTEDLNIKADHVELEKIEVFAKKGTPEWNRVFESMYLSSFDFSDLQKVGTMFSVLKNLGIEKSILDKFVMRAKKLNIFQNLQKKLSNANNEKYKLQAILSNIEKLVEKFFPKEEEKIKT